MLGLRCLALPSTHFLHLMFTPVQVALEFHRIRDSYPSFFQSQFGNKMWYTGKLGVYAFSKS